MMPCKQARDEVTIAFPDDACPCNAPKQVDMYLTDQAAQAAGSP